MTSVPVVPNHHPQNAGVAPLRSLLTLTFFGSISGGAFWSGIFFITARHYHFSPVRNLALAASMGFVYAIAARSAGGVQRWLARWMAPRTMLATTLSTWGIAALLPLLGRDHEAWIWGAAWLGSVSSALTWPVVESFLGGGRHGADMRRALGRFNMTWTSATAVPLLVLPLLAQVDELLTITMSAAANLVALIALSRLPRHPGAADVEASVAAVGREYPQLKQAASWLLPLAYLMSSTLAPLLPHRLAALGGTTAASVIAALWMVARFGTLAVMARVHFWHGRWGALVAAAMALCGGLAVVLLSSSLVGVIAGLLIFGAGTGLTYYAAIYYSLAVGHAAVDAGGGFEALIGVGYCAGPLIGLIGQVLGRPDPATARTYTVGLIWLAAVYFVSRTVPPFLKARRARA
ncbi:MAG TPA: hypothetical protein VGG33_29225 [Polyangia bacterium]